jgi:A/G-specific adenine glycosylase
MTLAAESARRKSIPAPQTPAGGPEAAALLSWYDRHRRKLPWRAPPGQPADAYAVWLSEIMLQQTTVKAVAPYYARFLARWPTVRALAAAPLDDVLKSWAGLGYYARARNLHACARAVVECHDGRFPDDEAALRALPGIGVYTAAAVAAIAFGRDTMPVDGNIERVVSRLFAVADALPAAKPTIRDLAQRLAPPGSFGDFAQGLMDLGATICTPARPACALCPWREDCRAHKLGRAEDFPKKSPRTAGRLRRGAAFLVLRRDGAVLVRTRPSRGLLGGMTEVPTTQWTHDFDEARALDDAPRIFATRPSRWRRLPGVVRHVFTHFPLELMVFATVAPARTRAPEGARFVALAEIDGEALPNLMRKVVALGMANSE